MKKWSLVVSLCLLVLALSASMAFAEVPGKKISNNLSTIISASEEITPITELTLSWVGEIPSSVTVGNAVDLTVKTTNTGNVSPIEKVLYIIEIQKDGINAKPDDVVAIANGEDGAGGNTVVDVPVGYDSTNGFFYFGDLNNGFTFSAQEATTTFTTTFKTAGKYTINAYAVQLP